MDHIDWIFKYIVEEERLKRILENEILDEFQIRKIKSKIELLQAAKEMTYSLMK
jgi:hypothetical protein